MVRKNTPKIDNIEKHCANSLLKPINSNPFRTRGQAITPNISEITAGTTLRKLVAN